MNAIPVQGKVSNRTKYLPEHSALREIDYPHGKRRKISQTSRFWRNGHRCVSRTPNAEDSRKHRWSNILARFALQELADLDIYVRYNRQTRTALARLFPPFAISKHRGRAFVARRRSCRKDSIWREILLRRRLRIVEATGARRCWDLADVSLGRWRDRLPDSTRCVDLPRENEREGNYVFREQRESSRVSRRCSERRRKEADCHCLRRPRNLCSRGDDRKCDVFRVSLVFSCFSRASREETHVFYSTTQSWHACDSRTLPYRSAAQRIATLRQRISYPSTYTLQSLCPRSTRSSQFSSFPPFRERESAISSRSTDKSPPQNIREDEPGTSSRNALRWLPAGSANVFSSLFLTFDGSLSRRLRSSLIARRCRRSGRCSQRASGNEEKRVPSSRPADAKTRKRENSLVHGEERREKGRRRVIVVASAHGCKETTRCKTKGERRDEKVARAVFAI